MNFSNPVYELSNHPGGLDVSSNMTEMTASANINEIPNVAFKVEHVLTPQNCPRGKLGSFRRELRGKFLNFNYFLLIFQMDLSHDGRLHTQSIRTWRA
jgi:hypothetical protein